MLGEEADRRYGEHRLWASVGWGLMAAVSGYLVDLDSEVWHFILVTYNCYDLIVFSRTVFFTTTHGPFY